VAPVTSLHALRARALASSALEGLAVGAVLASRAAPPWSRPRLLTATAAGALVAVDQLSLELPAVLRELGATGAVGQPPAHERRALLHAGTRALGLGLLLQVFDRPARAELARRGVAHPHRWFGLAAGLAHAAVVAPVYWRLGGERAAAEAERDASIEAELQAMASGR
jgi:hypothetical protein